MPTHVDVVLEADSDEGSIPSASTVQARKENGRRGDRRIFLVPVSFLFLALLPSSPRHPIRYIEVHVHPLLLAGPGIAIVRPLASTIGGEFVHCRGSEA